MCRLHGRKVGTCANESTGFLVNVNISQLEYEAALISFFGVNASDVLQLYPSSSAWSSLNRLVTDVAFTCPVELLETSLPLARRYVFRHAPSHDVFNPTECWKRYACHGCELGFVFGSDYFDSSEQFLASAVHELWLAFIRGEPMTQWPLGSILELVSDPHLVPSFRKPSCVLLNEIMN
jgi:carboxylesterase type B